MIVYTDGDRMAMSSALSIELVSRIFIASSMIIDESILSGALPDILICVPLCKQ